jgi:hypothetical protein
MRIDWQGYDDGLLSAEDRRSAEEALQTDPGSMAELEGLSAFKSAVREAGLREPVPVRRLEAMLSKVARPARPVGRSRWAMVAAAAACLALLAWAGVSMFGGRGDVLEERRSFDSMPEACAWAADVSGLPVPSMREFSSGALDSVHAGDGWACFDLVADGSLVHMTVASGLATTAGCEVVETEFGDVFYHTMTRSVSFNKDDLHYTLKGGERETMLKVAREVMKGTPRPDGKGPKTISS